MSKKFGGWSGWGGDLWGQADDWQEPAPSKKSWGTYERCYHKHKPLQVGEYLIYGGSCLSPMTNDADVYVGLDAGMFLSHRHYPWNDGTEVLFKIDDRQAPKNPEEFKKMIAWIADQLRDGKKVHVGCIGGHGRTGTVFAALVAVMTGEKDAITYVRKNYCDRAVETDVQVKFLATHFGITPVECHKPKYFEYGGGKKAKQEHGQASLPWKAANHNDRYVQKELQEVVPVATKGNIWGTEKPSFDKLEYLG